jgi:MFS family permease
MLIFGVLAFVFAAIGLFYLDSLEIKKWKQVACVASFIIGSVLLGIAIGGEIRRDPAKVPLYITIGEAKYKLMDY